MYRNFYKVLAKQDNIKFLEAKTNYTMFYFLEEQKLVSKTLRIVLNSLDKTKFCRCHRSFIVNLDHIVDVDLRSYTITMHSGEVVPISRRSKSTVRRFVMKYSNIDLKKYNRKALKINYLSGSSLNN